MKKKIIVSIIVIVILGGIAFFVASGDKTPVEYVTQTVKKGTLKQTVDATGKIESADKINLNFKITGRLSRLDIKAGDQVKAGQRLATLDTSALQSQVTDARARLDQTEAELQKLLAGASGEDIQIKTDTVKQKEQSVLAAKNELDNLILNRDTELKNLKDTAITKFNNEIITSQTALDEVTDTLTDSNVLVNLPAKDEQLRGVAENSKDNAQLSLSRNKSQSITLSSHVPDHEVIDALEELKSTLNLTNQALADTLLVLNATLTSSNLSQSSLDTFKDNIRAQQTLISAAQSTIQTAKSNWTNKQATYEDQITNQQDSIRAAENALQIAESELALKKSPPRQFEIDAAQANVNRAKASLSLALANLNDAIITAPLNGTITKKNYEVGEQTSLATPVLEMIGESKLQIEVDIPESDIAKVASSQDVEITLDAFGDDEVFAGKIIFVDPAETVIQDVVYYKVKVELSEQDERKKPGMTANVTILSQMKEDVVWVPSRAIKGNGEKYVEILENGLAIRKDVVTGLRGDLGTEITSGLNGGEEVITFVKEK